MPIPAHASAMQPTMASARSSRVNTASATNPTRHTPNPTGTSGHHPRLPEHPTADKAQTRIAQRRRSQQATSDERRETRHPFQIKRNEQAEVNRAHIAENDEGLAQSISLVAKRTHVQKRMGEASLTVDEPRTHGNSRDHERHHRQRVARNLVQADHEGGKPHGNEHDAQPSTGNF